MNRYILTAPVFFALVFSVSCVSFQVTSKSYTGDNFSFSEKDTFYLEPVTVTSFNFIEDEEIGYILDKKLYFAMSSSPAIRMREKPEDADFTVRPELIIKSYEVKYTERNYYYLSIKVFSNLGPSGGSVSHFTYEYNGASSIFDSKVQNLMIGKFIDDFTKSVNK
jgi:hypothetical protein